MKYIPHIPKKKRPIVDRPEDAVAAIPRITNDTVAEHREEVLGKARKFIYPLQHTRRRIIVISSSLLAVAIVAFFAGCTLALYKFQNTGAFVYDVTKVVPFPVAKVDGHYVAYENYLFELRRYIHYYETQQKLDFSTPDGQTQLSNQKQQALAKVENDAYVKQLAADHKITVSDNEVDTEVALLRQQNRLGSSDAVFQNVLEEYWGWSVGDFKRELKLQLLAQKVAATLDTATQQRAQNALAAVQKGTDFAAVVGQYSDDDATKANGGAYGAAVDKTNQDLAPQVLDQLFKLNIGQTSGIINTGDTLQIVKVTGKDGDKVSFSTIVCTFNDISTYTDPLRQKTPPKAYIHV